MYPDHLNVGFWKLVENEHILVFRFLGLGTSWTILILLNFEVVWSNRKINILIGEKCDKITNLRNMYARVIKNCDFENKVFCWIFWTY